MLDHRMQPPSLDQSSATPNERVAPPSSSDQQGIIEGRLASRAHDLAPNQDEEHDQAEEEGRMA